jgi:hypothetical protein
MHQSSATPSAVTRGSRSMGTLASVSCRQKQKASCVRRDPCQPPRSDSNLVQVPNICCPKTMTLLFRHCPASIGRTSITRARTARSDAERYIRPKAFSRSVPVMTSDRHTLLVAVIMAEGVCGRVPHFVCPAWENSHCNGDAIWRTRTHLHGFKQPPGLGGEVVE